MAQKSNDHEHCVVSQPHDCEIHVILRLTFSNDLCPWRQFSRLWNDIIQVTHKELEGTGFPIGAQSGVEPAIFNGMFSHLAH